MKIYYPHKPQKLLTIKEISNQIESGEYSAELLLMHLCHIWDEMQDYEEEMAEYEFLQETEEVRRQKKELLQQIMEEESRKIREQTGCPF